MEVIDNFLPEDLFVSIQETMLGPDFPWYYNDFIAYDLSEKRMFIPPEKDPWNDFQFIHNFYKLSKKYGYPEIYGYLKLIQPILKKLKIFCLLRCKANLTTLTPDGHIISGYHCDYEYNCTTADFYITTNNGYTIFKDTEEKVESVANRLVKFNSMRSHSGVSCTDEKKRVVINFNYIENIR